MAIAEEVAVSIVLMPLSSSMFSTSMAISIWSSTSNIFNVSSRLDRLGCGTVSSSVFISEAVMTAEIWREGRRISASSPSGKYRMVLRPPRS
ncbi:hypothetical protein D3C87_1953760 [compost metagenome]